MTPGGVDLELLRNFAIALFLGALVGLDRERKASAEPYFGGLRTNMLVGLAGAVAAWLGGPDGWLIPAGLLGLTALLAVAYVGSNAGERATGLTGEVAALVVFLLGAASTAGFPEIAVALGVTTAGLLAFKEPLHTLAGRVGPDDLTAGLKLLFATFVVLPLLPDRALDPLGVLNPYKLWWLVILISALSLGGYVAVRSLGERGGMVLTGLFGGLASSTATTLSAARQSRESNVSPDALAMSVLLAWAVMFVRVVVEVLVVNRSLLALVAPPMAAMALASALAAGWFGWRRERTALGPHVSVKNPFSLWEATKFALLFAAVLVAVEATRRYLGPGALVAVAALAGTTDVDAITLSMAEQARTDLAPHQATLAIVVAAAANTLVKAGMALAAGSRALAARVGGATVAVVAVGIGVGLAFRPG